MEWKLKHQVVALQVNWCGSIGCSYCTSTLIAKIFNTECKLRGAFLDSFLKLLESNEPDYLSMPTIGRKKAL